MSVKQISVFLENRPGRLIKITDLLARNNIDIRALSLAETKDFGIVRMIVDNSDQAEKILKDADVLCKFTPVLAYAVPDQPGGLNTLLDCFSKANINIEYMYAFLGGKATEQAYMIFRVAESDKAEEAMENMGIKSLTQEEIEEI